MMRGYLLIVGGIALIAALGTAALYIRNAERAKAELAQCRDARVVLSNSMKRSAANTAALNRDCRRNQSERNALERQLSEIETECAIPTPVRDCADAADGLLDELLSLIHI